MCYNASELQGTQVSLPEFVSSNFFTLKNISILSLFELFVTFVIENLWHIYFDVWTVQILIFELQHISVGHAVFRNIGTENIGERRKLSRHCLLLFLTNSPIHMRFLVPFYSNINFQWFKHPIYLVVLSLKSFHVIQVQPLDHETGQKQQPRTNSEFILVQLYGILHLFLVTFTTLPYTLCIAILFMCGQSCKIQVSLHCFVYVKLAQTGPPEYIGTCGTGPHEFLADKLTLFQSGAANHAHQIGLSPPSFLTFRPP